MGESDGEVAAVMVGVFGGRLVCVAGLLGVEGFAAARGSVLLGFLCGVGGLDAVD